MTGAALKAWRLKMNWSQDQLAQELGYAQKSVVSRWERGKSDIPRVVALAMRYLMTRIQPPPATPNVARLAETRPGQHWQPHEIALLKAAETSYYGEIAALAIRLGRTYAAINGKLDRMRKNGELPPARGNAGKRRGAYGRYVIEEATAANDPA